VPDDVKIRPLPLANYSTTDVDLTSKVWFSLDNAWDQGDVVASTSKSYDVDGAHAEHVLGLRGADAA
jgi:hypothetical protein